MATSIAIVLASGPATGGATSANNQVSSTPIGLTTAYYHFRPVFDLPLHTTYIGEVPELSLTLPPSTLPAAFPSPILLPYLPCTEMTPMTVQEPVLSSPSHPSLDALAEYIFDGSDHRTCTPAAPYAPSPLGSGDATAKGSPNVIFDSVTLFDSTTLTGAVITPHAEPPQITDHDGEAVPDQYEPSESFELVSPLSISAVNGGGGNDYVGAHAWWTDFAGLDPRFSASQTDQQRTRKLEQGQKQEQEQPFVVNLSGTTSPQPQIEPWTSIC